MSRRIGVTRLLAIAVLAAILAAGCAAGGGDPSPPPTGALTSPVPASSAVAGSGVIRFGHDYDPVALSIVGGSGRFRTDATEIAWRAEFSEAPRTASVELLLVGVSNQGVESVIKRLDVAIDQPEAIVLANKADLATLVRRKPGTYVIRYVREGTVLAEGTFKLVK